MKFAPAFLLLLMLLPGAYAQYYADIDITVQEDGYVHIEGATNHPELQSSHDMTSKQGKYWLLNISVNGTFSHYIYRLHLLEGSSINYIRTKNLARIESGQSLSIIGTGENDPFFVIMQYTQNTQEKGLSHDTWVIVALFFCLVFLMSGWFWYRKNHKKKEIHKENDASSSIPSYNSKALTQRQEEILNLIIQQGPLTQARIETIVKIPKSSLSRNVDALVRKGIITKESKGMSNVLSLKKL